MTTTFPPLQQRSFWVKFFKIFLFPFVPFGVVGFSNAAAAWEYQFVSNASHIAAAIAVLTVVSFVLAFLWQRSHKAAWLHQWLLLIIIFYVANCISTYGFAKLLKTQFQTPEYVKDTPVKDLGGFWLTWFYYGYSQTLAYIIGITQVGGSILLLFRKTRLPGVFILLPIMINICLINHFYAISPLAYFNSLHYTLILFFLLFLDYDTLKALFAYTATFTLNWKTVLLTIARAGVIAAAFFTISSLRSGIEPVTKMNGVWLVQSFAKNNVLVPITGCQDSIWTKLYFEWRYGCLFKYNLNKFEDKDLYGDYHVNQKQHTLLTSFTDSTNHTDSTLFHYQFPTDSTLTLSGTYQHNLIALKLKRVK